MTETVKLSFCNVLGKVSYKYMYNLILNMSEFVINQTGIPAIYESKYFTQSGSGWIRSMASAGRRTTHTSDDKAYTNVLMHTHTLVRQLDDAFYQWGIERDMANWVSHGVATSQKAIGRWFSNWYHFII